jgi:hypothetical protein
VVSLSSEMLSPTLSPSKGSTTTTGKDRLDSFHQASTKQTPNSKGASSTKKKQQQSIAKFVVEDPGPPPIFIFMPTPEKLRIMIIKAT